MQPRTTIAIAHRLPTIRNADVIFAIDHGTIVERGTHDELLAAGGLYARLYKEQFGDGLVEAHCSDGVILANGRACRPLSQRARPSPEIAARRPTEPERVGELPAELRTALAVRPTTLAAPLRPMRQRGSSRERSSIAVSRS